MTLSFFKKNELFKDKKWGIYQQQTHSLVKEILRFFKHKENDPNNPLPQKYKKSVLFLYSAWANEFQPSYIRIPNSIVKK